MSKELFFLGIESSCDETAASIVKEDKKGNVTILSNIISSQTKEHKPFGGVVPELAARSHVEKIDTIIKNETNDEFKFEDQNYNSDDEEQKKIKPKKIRNKTNITVQDFGMSSDDTCSDTGEVIVDDL